jgi:hypothetical protein
MAKMMAQHVSLWDTASPKHLVDLLEAVEFEAGYRTALGTRRAGGKVFEGYTPLEESDDLEAILAHYTRYKRKYHSPNWRYEFRRDEPGNRPQPWYSAASGRAGAAVKPETAQAAPRRDNAEKTPAQQAHNTSPADTGNGSPARNAAPSSTSPVDTTAKASATRRSARKSAARPAAEQPGQTPAVPDEMPPAPAAPVDAPEEPPAPPVAPAAAPASPEVPPSTAAPAVSSHDVPAAPPGMKLFA